MWDFFARTILERIDTGSLFLAKSAWVTWVLSMRLRTISMTAWFKAWALVSFHQARTPA